MTIPRLGDDCVEQFDDRQSDGWVQSGSLWFDNNLMVEHNQKTMHNRFKVLRPEPDSSSPRYPCHRLVGPSGASLTKFRQQHHMLRLKQYHTHTAISNTLNPVANKQNFTPVPPPTTHTQVQRPPRRHIPRNSIWKIFSNCLTSMKVSLS